jgi:hypothetical protein
MDPLLGGLPPSRPRRTRGFSPLAPLRVVGALVGAVVVAVVALLTLGVALLFLRGRGRVFTWRMGGPAPRPGVGADPAGGAPRVEPETTAGAAPTTEPAAGRRERSYAEVIETLPIVAGLALALALAGAAAAPAHARLLVPMDDRQTDHLKAYGLTYWVLTHGQRAEWLLNYRGGSFLLPDDPATEREANLRGVSIEVVSGSDEAGIRATIADENMEAVALEKAPRVAVYIPPNTPPWDDAVTLALKYADIPYATVWDDDVIHGELPKYDWLHLHHEDFTGQHGKFYVAYHDFAWYREEEAVQKATATRLGFSKVTQLKGAVALAIRDYVERGGFMFGMCSATDTYDIALAALGTDIADVVYDGDPPDPQAQRRLDYTRTLAFKDFRLEMDPFTYRFSDIDVTAEATQRGPDAFFTLFDFSARNDPVASMLVQDHVAAVPEFLGQSTGFRRSRLKSGVLALAEVEGTDEVKYLHGQCGRGTFTFLGGHDPEDYQHMVGDPPTDLAQYRHSPGYRLILNNVLFPAAEKKKQRT